MASIRISWRAGKVCRCPICDSDHSCSATDDDLFFCWREHRDVPGWIFLGDTRNGFAMFRDSGRSGGDPATLTPETARRHGSADASQRNGSVKPIEAIPTAEIIRHLQQHLAGADDRRKMAEILGVHPDALRALRMGYVPETDEEEQHWLFPERDARGQIIGLLRRYLDGRKRQMPGTRRGIMFDPDADPTGLVLLVEGASDIATAWTLGLCGIGRPSNLGGAEYLADALGPSIRDGAEVVVMGENDLKEDGRWPGREGAEHVAGELAKAWGRPVSWVLPPEGTKDLRDWAWAGGKLDVHDRAGCQELGQKIVADVRNRMVQVVPAGCTFPSLDSLGHGGDSVDKSIVDTSTMSQTPQEIREERSRRREENPTPVPSLDSLGHCPPGPLRRENAIGPVTRQVIDAGMHRRPCPTHYTPLLQSKTNPRLAAALRVDCARYTCSVCGPRRRSRWLIHLMCCFDASPTLFAGVVADEKAFTALRKPIHRADAEYVAVRMTVGGILVVCTAEVPRMNSIDTPAAAERVAEAMLALARCRQPISTSRPWALPDDRQAGDYRRRGSAPRGAFPLVVGRLERRKLPPAVQRTDAGARANWEFPAGWPEEHVDLMFDILAAPLGPDEEQVGGVS